MSEFDLSGDTSADYGFDGTDSFTSGSENVSTTGPSGGGGDENFFGGSNVNVMDFGRGPVSNITNASNYDPNFAALGMIGRGLTPNSALRNQISFDVPSQMLPQIEGSLGPIGPKFYSPLEKTLVEMEPVGIMAMAGKAFQSIKDSFTDAKNTLGKMGDAVGGLSLSDLTGAFSSKTGQEAVGQMADNVAFDAFGSPIDLTDTRQISGMSQTGADITTMPRSIASVTSDPILPDLRQQFTREGRIGGDIRSGLTYMGPGGNYTFSETMDQIKPAGRDAGAIRSPDVYSEGDFDIKEEDIQVADAGTFNILQGLGTKFNPEVNRFLQQNISPNLRFDTNPRRDPDDPNKLMPFMGLEYRFTA